MIHRKQRFAAVMTDVEEEFAAYGMHIGSVHIKDRVTGELNGSVRGRRDVNFPALARCLKRVDYGKGDFVLPGCAKGIPGGRACSGLVQNRAFLL